MFCCAAGRCAASEAGTAHSTTVATVVVGRREAGIYTIRWDGRDDSGRALASGVYLCRLRAGGEAQTRKLLLVR